MENTIRILIALADWFNGSKINETYALDSLFTNLLIIRMLEQPSRQVYDESIELQKQQQWRERNRKIKGLINQCLETGTK